MQRRACAPTARAERVGSPLFRALRACPLRCARTAVASSCWQCGKRAVERPEVVRHGPRQGCAHARYGPVHLVVGRACVHMSGSMDRLCYIKYAKPTGHVPQLVYDAWHNSKGRFESQFFTINRYFTPCGAGRTHNWPQVGLDQYSGDIWSWLRWNRAPETSTRSLNGRHDGRIGLRSGPKKNPTYGRQDDRLTGRNHHFPGLLYAS